MPQLSVVIATSRPQWLANCLHQYSSQSLGGLKTELIVVAEGDPRHFRSTLSHHGVDAVFKPVQGRCGAFAKDVGLARSTGDYVCFWDDDNIYYPHALTLLYATALGHDIGIACAGHMANEFGNIPSQREVKYGDIDTMCFCVRSELAKQVRWADHVDKGTDYAYLMKLLWLGANTRWVDVSVGEKLIEDMEGHC